MAAPASQEVHQGVGQTGRAEPAEDQQGRGGARQSFAAAQGKVAGAGIHCQPWEQIPDRPYSRGSLGIQLLALSKPLSAGTKAMPALLLFLKEYPCFLELSVTSASRAVPTTPSRTTQDSRRPSDMAVAPGSQIPGSCRGSVSRSQVEAGQSRPPAIPCSSALGTLEAA